MPLPPEVDLWNRRVHYFSGLFLLLFLILFGFTGLLLNHPGWRFAEFWPQRKQTVSTVPVRLAAGTDVEVARDVMRQLNLRGEIEWIAPHQAPGTFAFRVQRPGHSTTVRATAATAQAQVERIELNGWGIIHVLHTFSGERPGGTPSNHRDWALTTAWALAMDGVAVAMIVMVFSSYLMWWRYKRKSLLAGVVALLAGFAVCGAFLLDLLR